MHSVLFKEYCNSLIIYPLRSLRFSLIFVYITFLQFIIADAFNNNNPHITATFVLFYFGKIKFSNSNCSVVSV